MSYIKNSTSSLIPSLYNLETKELESTFHQKYNIFRSTLFLKPPILAPIDLTLYISSNT